MGYLAPITLSGSDVTEMLREMDTFRVDNIEKYVESMEVVHRDKFITKETGFETMRHVAATTIGNDVEVDVRIQLERGTPRIIVERLAELARGVNGAGMELNFNDDWATNKLYHGRWTNAGDFTDVSVLSAECAIHLECWEIGNAA